MKEQEKDVEKCEQEKTRLSPEWSQEAQDELQDFIESQGIYIRQ